MPLKWSQVDSPSLLGFGKVESFANRQRQTLKFQSCPSLLFIEHLLHTSLRVTCFTHSNSFDPKKKKNLDSNYSYFYLTNKGSEAQKGKVKQLAQVTHIGSAGGGI